ncbi:NadS family protein [Buttiauxella gaviniae]|uniref:NadS family protein n=1 Tax=Buttiauxella gaviniae TaxID=82990 RepID=UPI0039AF0114
MRKELFNDLIASAKEAVEIHKGLKQPARVTKFALPDVKEIRKNTGLKQDDFAFLVGVSPSLVQSWEQKKRTPSGSSLKLLRMIQINPSLIEVLKLA